MDSSPSRGNAQLPPIAGVKRRASLLPAFEPVSSSPSLPRPVKRIARDLHDEQAADAIKYPTPLPTSSTDMMPSSPPQLRPSARPPLRRTQSTVSERAPLSAVPSIILDGTGEPALLGRSSVSCHYQLSADRLISRVHVKAIFKAAPSLRERDRVEITCMGWNGVKIHCQGIVYELKKGDTFTSDRKETDILVDVHSVRVLIQWPRRERKDSASTDDGTWEDENSPRRHPHNRQSLQSSSLRSRQRLASPVSPSPAAAQASQQIDVHPSSPFLRPDASRNPVQVYEDAPSPESSPVHYPQTGATQSTQHASQIPQGNASQPSSFSSALDLSDHDEENEPDEENDPIIHSFGPFGANILPRMAAFTAGGSRQTSPGDKPPPPSSPLRPASRSPSPILIDESNIRNHAINQLAFSRLSSTPLSTILSNLPSESGPGKSSSGTMSKMQLKTILDATECIGEVTREGKDAAGKPLESEYYYVPNLDQDEKRKEAVVTDLMKPGLRSCRKQHKQYYWRKPKN